MKMKLAILILVLLACNIIYAQTNLSGTWNGILNVAGELHLVLHVTQLADGTYSGTLDSPDQNVSGIKCDSVVEEKSISGSALKFTINKIKVSYTGKLLND